MSVKGSSSSRSWLSPAPILTGRSWTRGRATSSNWSNTSPRTPNVNRNDLGAAHLAFFVDDLDRFYAETSKKGLRYNNPPASQFDDQGKVSMKACYAQDPDGNWLEFVETF